MPKQTRDTLVEFGILLAGVFIQFLGFYGATWEHLKTVQNYLVLSALAALFWFIRYLEDWESLFGVFLVSNHIALFIAFLYYRALKLLYQEFEVK